MFHTHRQFVVATLGVAWIAVAFSGCSDRKMPEPWQAPGAYNGTTGGRDTGEGMLSGAVDGGDTTANAGQSGSSEPAEPCVPARSKEPVPARTTAVQEGESAPDEIIFTRDLFNQFYKYCGGCHVDGASGNFRIESFTQFPTVALQKQAQILARITSDDPALFMPPLTSGGVAWGTRSPDDAMRKLHGWLEAWFQQSAPPETFTVAGTAMAAGALSYALDSSIGAALTNIGNCMPSKEIVGQAGDKMGALDSMFASATALPDQLSATDLTTFDSEQLAREGVISFAPGYPLFSDNARKMRHVRVPSGQSIEFDPATQEFSIPSNTRFYKTFLKHIVDKQGQERYRKIETRLIVSRPDGADNSDGSHDTHSLFGSYLWDENESKATLVKDPLRNGKPFADHLLTYYTDEGKAAEILAGNPLRPLVALREAGVTRTYAVPGSERCTQCHMGSHNHSYVLGFTPMQISRRPEGEGGDIEPVGEDELNQLQRLIDYRVITGLTSADDIAKLEDSQGDRKPRNEYELRAQGYMFGNCSHCHNPRGYATVQNPQLRDVLRFFPDREGGVFQFPLDRVSPRIHRGQRQDVDIPYITPSLFDRENGELTDSSLHHQFTPVNLSGDAYYQTAPWRSLIYRNVDSPFTYAEDYALFPHMPMNVAGFDCRVPRIMGDWMVSIPSRKVDSKLNERWDSAEPATVVGNPQPYVEVKPDDPKYEEAVVATTKRMNIYHKGGLIENIFRSPIDTVKAERTYGYPRYDQYCPDTSDIIDPSVGIGSEAEVASLTPVDDTRMPSLTMPPTDQNQSILVSIADGVPDRPHWVETDTTDPPGDWAPRRPDWSDILVKQQVDLLDDKQKKVVSLVQSVHADDEFRKFALADAPFSMWQEKPDCNFASVPKVKDISAAARPAWLLEKIKNAPSADAAENLPIYVQSPGEMVFHEICVNCHGPRFDSRGRQADTLMLMTGGASRVANLREGLLGPSMDPGANRARVFDSFKTADATGQDWTARYVAWMGLGGTARVIPPAILSVVGTAAVFGEDRPGTIPVTDANMLSIARILCGMELGRIETRSESEFDVHAGVVKHDSDHDGTSLINSNGDADFWLKLCGFRNDPPIRVLSLGDAWAQQKEVRTFFVGQRGWYRRDSYPANAPVGNQHGEVVNGISDDNVGPWCVVGPNTDVARANVDFYIQGSERKGKALPFCPASWLPIEQAIPGAPATDPSGNPFAQTYKMTDDELTEWATRGAINAGVSVFFYLDKLLRGEQSGEKLKPSFDHCEDL